MTSDKTPLEQLRDGGWSVAVHNDYRIDGVAHTFWLFTHPEGIWIKGEGRTDELALADLPSRAHNVLSALIAGRAALGKLVHIKALL